MKEGVSMKKRVTSLFLALLMAVTLLPVQALADELNAADNPVMQEDALPILPINGEDIFVSKSDGEELVKDSNAAEESLAASALPSGSAITATLAGDDSVVYGDVFTLCLTVDGANFLGGEFDLSYFVVSASGKCNINLCDVTIIAPEGWTIIQNGLHYLLYGTTPSSQCKILFRFQTFKDYGYGHTVTVSVDGLTVSDGTNESSFDSMSYQMSILGNDPTKCGKNLTWSLTDDGTLTISGTGPMYDYDSQYTWGQSCIHVPWDRMSIKNVIIEDGVSRIGNCAFEECLLLQSISIPSSVTTIGYRSFSGCSRLRDIELPSFVSSIEGVAFYGCKSLTQVTIPDSVREIGNDVFTNCTGLTTVVLPSGLTQIPENAFYRCEKLSEIILPDDLTSIESCAFYGCTSLAEIALPDNLVTINWEAFENCTALTELQIPVNVSLIGSQAFKGCTGLKNIIVHNENPYYYSENGVLFNKDRTELIAYPAKKSDGQYKIPDGVTTIVYSAFQLCSNLKCIIIPDSINSIEECAFAECSSLENIEIPDNVTSIGLGAFYDCYKLKNAKLPSSITTIAYRAFNNCVNLSSITIPAKVQTIEGEAFAGCSNLSMAEFLGNAPVVLGRRCFSDVSSQFTITYYSSTSGWTTPVWNGYPTICADPISDYSTLDDNNRNAQGIYFKLNWLSKTAVVGDGSKQQNSCGYTGGQQGAVVIPDTVTKGGATYTVKGINQHAFEGCPFVRSVTLGANVTTVSPSAFRNCKYLTSFSVSKDNTFFKAYDGVLYDLSGLYLYAYPEGKENTSYTPLATCRTIGKTSFFGARNLTVLNIPATVTAIHENAFGFCPNLQEITLPFVGGGSKDQRSFRYVFDNYALDGYIWDSSPDMELMEFFNLSNDSGGIPASLKTVTILQANFSDGSFADCSKLEEIFFPNCNDLTTIPERCFYGCSSLTQLLLGQSKSSTQTGILIPASVTTIEPAAFAGCDRISQFVVSAGNTAFAADQWGVLYSRDMSVLRYYPAGREWPYYNVNDRTRTIDAFAFMNCGELVNVYIPKTVTTLELEAISQCPMVTFCVYCDSAADRYMSQHSLTAWYMDNCTLQNIEIIHLPDQVISAKNKVFASSLYAKGAYSNEGQTIELQLEDYTLSFSQPYGKQEVTLTSGGKTVTFEAPVIRQGNINGNATAQSDIDASDMQCLYTYLATGENIGQIKDTSAFALVSDINNDGSVDVYDLQLLYEAVSGISKL